MAIPVHRPGVLFTVTFEGQVIVGGCVSLTVTVKLHCAVLPEASVAVEVTVVVPTGNTEPEAGDDTTVTPGQLSEAVTVKFTTAPHWPGELLVVMLAGQVIVGGWVSLTVMVNEQVAPDPSDTFTAVVPTGKKDPEAGTAVMGPQLP